MLVLQNIESAGSSASLSTFHVRRPRYCWGEFSFRRGTFYIHILLISKENVTQGFYTSLLRLSLTVLSHPCHHHHLTMT